MATVMTQTDWPPSTRPVTQYMVSAGHDLAAAAGSLGSIKVDREEGVLHGAADPRRLAYAFGR